VVLKVLLDEFLGDIASTPTTIPNGPEVLSPIPFAKLWEFELKQT
jgi:hypothetical protein